MARRLPAPLATFAFVSLAASVSWVAAGPIFTDDLWWHLTMGDFYAAQGPFAKGDPLLHTAHAEAPVPHEWLFGVAVHAIDRAAGMHGLRAVHALGLLGILGLALAAFRRQSASWPEVLLAASAFLVLSWFRLVQFRPDLVSIPATLVLLQLWVEPREPISKRRVAAGVVLLAVWANLHSLFALAFPLLGASIVGMGLRAWLASRRGEPDGARREGRRAARLTVALGLGLLASALNPRGFAQHLTFFTSSSETAIWSVLDEWTRFDPFSLAYVQGVSRLSWALTDLLLVVFLAAGALGAWRWLRFGSARDVERFDPVLAALGLASVVALLVSIRFLWMTFFPLLFLLRAARGAAGPRPGGFAAAAATAALLLLAAWPFWSHFPRLADNIRLPARAWLELPYVPWQYEAAGTRFLRETGFRGKLSNPYGLGGYLAYWLAPDVQTFIDGRTEHYPPQVLKDALRIASRRGREPGQQLPELLDARGVDLFFGVGFPDPETCPSAYCTAAHLADEPGWLLVSRSVHHALYLRANARNRVNLARIAAWYEAQGVPFDPETGLDPAKVIRERPEWAAAHEMLPRRGARPGALPVDEDERFASIDELARVHALLGSFDAQIALEREALRLRPAARDPRRRLAYALLRTGKPQHALAEMRRLRALDPTDALSRSAQEAVQRYVRATRQEDRRPRGDPVPALAYAEAFPLLTETDRAWLRQQFYGTRLEARGPRSWTDRVPAWQEMLAGHRDWRLRELVSIGQPPASLYAELGTQQTIPRLPDQIVIGLPTELVRQRPDVRRAERSLAAQGAQIGDQRTLFLREDEPADGERRVTRNLIRIYRALGGSWSSSSTAPPTP